MTGRDLTRGRAPRCEVCGKFMEVDRAGNKVVVYSCCVTTTRTVEEAKIGDTHGRKL